ncbi:MAG: MerR family transcriptional regulator [Acidobacteriia bacterium]|nr:MerR family transcriptional regulator [Terriglobia bacterium]
MKRARNPLAARAVQQGYLSIKTVIQRTGAHRQTIHYYMHKGLLPQPARTSRTSALYPPSTVDLIELVKAFQQQHRLSLDEIAGIFQRLSYDVRAISGELEARNLTAPGSFLSGGETFLSGSQILASLDPPAKRTWLDAVLAKGLIQPFMREGEEAFSLLAAELVRTIWNGVRLGISLDQFEKLNALITAEARKEVDQLRSLMGKHSFTDDAYRQVANLFSVVERFGSLQRKAALHSGFMLNAQESLYLFVGANRKYTFPSETFLARMGLNREIDRLLLHLDQNAVDLAALCNLARAYHLRSDWVHLNEISQEILRIDPNNEGAMAYLGQSLTYLGRHDEAVTTLETFLKATANPVVKLRYGQALVSRARRMSDPGKLLDAIVKKARLFSEAVRDSRHQPALYRKIRLNLLLDNMSLSDPLCLQGPSVEELEQLHQEFSSIRERGLPVLGKISLAMARMFVTYALYVIRQREGHRDAIGLRREILSIDPNGVLAARSAKPAAKKTAARKKAQPARKRAS